jgi:hypothetical protein
MAALQILAIAQAIAVVCALPWARIHRFHFMQLFAGQDTSLAEGASPPHGGGAAGSAVLAKVITAASEKAIDH